MEAYKPVSIIFLLFLSTSLIWAAARLPCEFDRAREEIEKHSEVCLKYDDTLCSKIDLSGVDKLACRLKNVPSVVFLVCKVPKPEGEDCHKIIENEVKNLLKLQREPINIRTVEVDFPPIYNKKCGATEDLTCSGLLERWVDESEGSFGHVRNYIHEDTVDQLIAKVRQITTPVGLQTTIADLKKIVAFMQPASSGDNYKQICDLQGFFLKAGGFLVADTPDINENIAGNKGCWDGEPTTDLVLAGLNRMITELSKVVRRWKLHKY